MTNSAAGNASAPRANGDNVRERILATAANLFYHQGVRAVGVDLIVERAGVAKTSLYRHFSSKDDLIEAFLKREDEDFWRKWDSVASDHEGDPEAELEAHLAWIGQRIARPNYRGCPQLNVAAEFADPDHPARAVGVAHKAELRKRLKIILKKMGAARPGVLATQLTLVINGAFMSRQIFGKEKAANVLSRMTRALIRGMSENSGQ